MTNLTVSTDHFDPSVYWRRAELKAMPYDRSGFRWDCIGIPKGCEKAESWRAIRFLGCAMTKPYSADLRVRVVEAADEGATRHEAGERFGVSVSSAVRWHQLWRHEGTIGAKPYGGSCSPLEDNAEELLAVIEDQPDLRLDEIVAVMRKRQIPGCRTALFRFWRVTPSRQKKSFALPNRSGLATLVARLVSPALLGLPGTASEPCDKCGHQHIVSLFGDKMRLASAQSAVSGAHHSEGRAAAIDRPGRKCHGAPCADGADRGVRLSRQQRCVDGPCLAEPDRRRRIVCRARSRRCAGPSGQNAT